MAFKWNYLHFAASSIGHPKHLVAPHVTVTTQCCRAGSRFLRPCTEFIWGSTGGHHAGPVSSCSIHLICLTLSSGENFFFVVFSLKKAPLNACRNWSWMLVMSSFLLFSIVRWLYLCQMPERHIYMWLAENTVPSKHWTQRASGGF